MDGNIPQWMVKMEDNLDQALQETLVVDQPEASTPVPFSGSELPSPRDLQFKFPKAWYLFGRESELVKGPVT